MVLSDIEKNEYYEKYNRFIFKKINDKYKQFPFLEYDNIYSLCMLTFVKCLNQYNYENPTAKFITYLGVGMDNEILMALRNHNSDKNRALFINNISIDSAVGEEGLELAEVLITQEEKEYVDSNSYYEGELRHILARYVKSQAKIDWFVNYVLYDGVLHIGYSVQGVPCCKSAAWKFFNNTKLKLQKDKDFLTLMNRLNK